MCGLSCRIANVPSIGPRDALVTTRTAIGVGSWAAPGLAGGLFGLDVAANPQSPYLARLFGVRDLALGVGVAATQGEARKLWLKIGIACDLADAAAGVLAGRGKYLDPIPTALVTGTALLATGLGVLALRAES
jgi:hypothetical protein